MMGGPPKQVLGSRLEGTELRAVVRWKGADPRTRANREPWKWDENGLAMASPRRAADSQWRSLRQRREELRQRREAGASHADAAPHNLVTEDVLAQNPGLSEGQLRRAASYCGCSRRRFDAYLEAFSRQDAIEAKYDWGESVSSIVEEYCVEQEELVATGRYVREAEPTRIPNRRRRKPLLITRAASEPASCTDSDQEQTDNQEDGVEQTVLAPALSDRPCTPLAELGEASWPGTQHCVHGGLLVLGDDGEPESYHALKHPEANATELSPAGDRASASEASSDSFSDDGKSDALSDHMSRGDMLEAELEELVGKQHEKRCTDDDTAGRPVSPIKAYLRLERRRPTTSAHARHDHAKAEAAFAQLRAQLAGLKQRPQTCPLSPAAAAAPSALVVATEATQLETAKGCAHAKAVARNSTSRAGVSLVASFGGMPASHTVGSYRRGRAGTGSPPAGLGGYGGSVDLVSGLGSSVKGSGVGETALFGVEFSPSSQFVAKITGRDAARSQGNIATPPSSPPKPKPQAATGTTANAARGNAAGCISLDPVYRPLATRTTSGGASAPLQSAALPARTSWMSISAPSLPLSPAMAVDMHARAAGAYPQPEQSTRLVRLAARGALSRQRRGAAASVRKMREGVGLSRELGRGQLAVVAGAMF